ncbi:hypothetical protein WOSG25_190050 [Weissella oryzae SG25]|uniref:Uncharacterized protein n=1 Tax=Weissella oryzae (strain DSM 25784 / JCM 18191 / LMG 30913 / SG25) TaxID=1329250 RepID=A0A069CWZ4_WEIOS|nr:hypothetical protein WOSG25_190050 [Weissella oryzae SG25]
MLKRFIYSLKNNNKQHDLMMLFKQCPHGEMYRGISLTRCDEQE